MAKITNRLLLALALVLGYNAASAQAKVSTETELVSTESKKGIPLHRTEIILDQLKIKYDALKNFSPTDDQQNIGAIFLNDVYRDSAQSISIGALNLGNFNGDDETFWDAWTTIKHKDQTFGIDVGSSVRKKFSPRYYIIGSSENISLSNNIKLAADLAYVTPNAAQNEQSYRIYAWAGLCSPELFISLGNEIKTKHAIVKLANTDLGYFGWFKKSPDGTWSITNTLAAGEINNNFYNNQNMIKINRAFVMPSFFVTYLDPSESRGAYTIGIDINGDSISTTARILPGLKTPIGSIGIGTETKISDNTPNTGVLGAYFNTFSVSGIQGSVEINYNGRTKDLEGHVKASYDIGSKK
jgi:hypothetical protein